MNNNSIVEYLKQFQYKITEVKHDKRIDYIKSFDKPPWDENDIYWHRYPWQKFGCVSSGICMAWYWYRDDVILKNCIDEDIEEACQQMRDYYG